MQKMTIPYGDDKTIEFEVERNRVVFDGSMKETAPLENLQDTLRARLDDPIGCAPVRDMVSSSDRVLILIEDATRTTPVSTILPVLVDYLVDLGLRQEQIEILTAPGSHRILTDDELLEKVGPDLIKRLKINQHDYKDESSLMTMPSVHIAGIEIPVQINRKIADFDFIIGIGNIVPHSDAGYSGGAKIFQPGICGYPTTAATHISAAMLDEIPLGVVDNPCRLGMEEVARRAGLKFIINTVKNYRGEVIDVVAGDFVEAHRLGARVSRDAFSVQMKELADIVVVSSYPADLDFWQALKGVTSAYFAVKPGGFIIFASPCHEGFAQNHPRFHDWLKMSHREILEKAKNAPVDDKSVDLISAVLATCNSRARERASILAVSHGLTDFDLEVLGYKRCASVQSALDYALKQMPTATIGILPRGGDVLPVLAK
ncbi:nickel-dependent lactate racemase family protein [Desulforhopalus singaporensis]|uniref:Nickel-dependent lactate racemase n=1 Tax=Desulforhopalus singaporensis TaxID=91360 RepID=A0A1H0UD77_9BACT|nr:nickel-dependent lactate racemase [Desulforhopalus singaporensis]SDP64139.1 Nickel-dependent lactate racemase [Desulforhopalus singaporensis]